MGAGAAEEREKRGSGRVGWQGPGWRGKRGTPTQKGTGCVRPPKGMKALEPQRQTERPRDGSGGGTTL